jgi:hypothetical protein
MKSGEVKKSPVSEPRKGFNGTESLVRVVEPFKGSGKHQKFIPALRTGIFTANFFGVVQATIINNYFAELGYPNISASE